VHRQAPDSLFTNYRRAALTLEDFQAVRQKTHFEAAQARFSGSLQVFGAVPVLALLAGAWARTLLIRSVVRPVDRVIHFFDRIASGDLVKAPCTLIPCASVSGPDYPPAAASALWAVKGNGAPYARLSRISCASTRRRKRRYRGWRRSNAYSLKAAARLNNRAENSVTPRASANPQRLR